MISFIGAITVLLIIFNLAEGKNKDAITHKSDADYVEVPQMIVIEAQEAYLKLQSQKQSREKTEVKETQKLMEMLGTHDQRDFAYKELTTGEKEILPVAVDYYFKAKDEKIKTQLLIVISRKCNQGNYSELLPILVKECFKSNPYIRNKAILALSNAISVEPPGRKKKPWLPERDFNKAINILAKIANSGSEPFEFYQTTAGLELYKFGFYDLIPNSMLNDFKSGPMFLK